MFSIILKNSFIFPLVPVRVYVGVLSKDIYLPQKKALIALLPPLKEIQLDIKSVPGFRGEYHIGFEKAEFFDVLKLFSFSVKSKQHYTFISYPREKELTELYDESRDENEALRSKPDNSFEKNTFSHLREYKEGESLRHIHWKLSARLPDENLIVKQMEANHNYSALIFCDFTLEFPDIETTLEVSDTIIEIALAITRRIIKNRNTARCIHSPDELYISNLYDYGELLETLTRLPAMPAPDTDFTDLLYEHTDEFQPERAVYIITAAVNDELIEALRNTGLMTKDNVTLLVTESPFYALIQDDKIDYLQNETKIGVIRVELL